MGDARLRRRRRAGTHGIATSPATSPSASSPSPSSSAPRPPLGKGGKGSKGGKGGKCAKGGKDDTVDLGDAVGKGGKDGASGHVGEGAAAPPTGTGVSAPPAPPRPHRPKALTDPAETVPAARPPSTTGPFGDVWHDIKRRILAKAGSPTDGRLPRSWAARGPVYLPSPRAHGSAFSNRTGSIHRLPRPRHRRTGRATSHAALRGREDGAQQRLTTHVFRCIVRLDHCLITAPQLACHSDGATSLDLFSCFVGSSHGNGEDGASHGGFPIAPCAPPYGAAPPQDTARLPRRARRRDRLCLCRTDARGGARRALRNCSQHPRTGREPGVRRWVQRAAAIARTFPAWGSHLPRCQAMRDPARPTSRSEEGGAIAWRCIAPPAGDGSSAAA